MSKLLNSYVKAIQHQGKNNLNHDEQAEVNDFRKNLEEYHGTSGHKMADSFWGKIWSETHDGLKAVNQTYKDLIKNFKNEQK